MKRLPATSYRGMPSIVHGVRPSTQGIVIHTIEGSATSAMNWFENPLAEGVGAHVIIGISKCWQLCDLSALTYHARGANSTHIGFEHEGFSGWNRLRWVKRRKQRKMSANRAAWICYQYGLGMPRRGKNLFAHADFPQGGHGDPGPGWPWDLYVAHARRAYRNLVKSNGKKWTR